MYDTAGMLRAVCLFGIWPAEVCLLEGGDAEDTNDAIGGIHAGMLDI